MDSLLVFSIVLLSLFTLSTGVFAQTEIPYDQKMNEVETETATFALGCFWGPDASFGALEGAVRTRVGYAGGTAEDPTYKRIGDHTETIEIDYDPDVISYRELLEIFFDSHNPYSQAYSRQYASLILYNNSEQQNIALEMKEKLNAESNREIKTEIKKLDKFYLAENYHQKFRLQQQVAFREHYLDQMTMQEFINSPAVTKANGYITGNGERDNIIKNIAELGLTTELQERL